MQVAIARELVERADVEVALSYDRNCEVSHNLSLLSVPRLMVGGRFFKVGGHLWLICRLLLQPFDALRLVVFCRVRSIDVVFEVMGNPLQLLPRWVLRKAGVKVVTSIHDAARHSGEESRLLSWLDRFDLRWTDGVMAYSDAVANELPEGLVPIFTTVHGAFGRNSGSGPRRLPEGRVPVLGFFGRIRKYKGLDRLTEAVLLLRGRGLDVRVRVVGSGEIAPPVLQSLNSLEAEIDNRWVDQSDIEETVASFDLLVLPYDEASQSGVVGFAFRAGVPVVCTPVGGLAEQVRVGGGVVANDMTVQALADAIESVIISKEAYGEISSQEIKAVESAFSWARVAGDVLEASYSVARRR